MPNLIPIGIDIPKLEADKEAAKAILRELYAELTKFSELKVSPINITGLSELNASIAATNQAMATLKTTVSEFGLAMQQYNRTADAVATTQAKISVASSQEAKDLAALKVQLAELNKQNLENAKNDNAIIQNKLLHSTQAKALADKEKQDLASITILRKQNADAQKREDAERIANDRKLKESQQQKIKSDQEEARNILALSNDYQLLLTRQKELQSQYAQLFASGLGKTDAGKSVLQDLGEVNGVLSTIDKNLETAGSGGATTFARALTSGLSSLRTIAYILPGIGIAGIFNVAFEAIQSVFDGVDNVHKSMQQIIEDQQKYNQLLKEEDDLLKQIDSDEERRAKSSKISISTQDITQKFAQEHGQSPEASAQGDLNISEREYTVVQSRVLREFGDYKNLQKAIDNNLKQLEVLEKSVEQLDAKRKVINTKAAPKSETNPLKGITANDRDDKALDALITLRKSQFTQLQDATKDNQELLDKYLEGEKQFGDKKITQEKLIYDQERQKNLDLAKQQSEDEINAQKIILNRQLSTQQERIDAINKIKEASDNRVLAENQFIQSNRDLSPKEKEVSTDKTIKALIQNKKEANEQIDAVDREFYERRSQANENALQSEIVQDQVANEQIFKDQAKTYNDRFVALQKYLEDRRTAIQVDFEFQKDKAEREIPKDLLPSKIEEITKNRDQKLAEVTNNVQQEIYSIVDTWYKKQFDLIVGSKDKQILETVRAEAKELKDLNDSYAAKSISYEKYWRRRKEIEKKYAVATPEEQLENDKNKLSNLLSLRGELDSKINFTREQFINADTPEKAKEKGLELDDLLEKRKELDVQIIDQQKKTDDESLKLELAKNKKTEENKKAFYANLIKLERELFRLTKQIVDESYQYRIDKLEAQNKAYDEQVDREKDAITRSTLNEKDKNAYEIQLEAQKTAADKKAADEEKKLKHDQAVFDKKINIAEIITSTSLGVAKTLADGGGFAIPLAISVGALGAVALATALAASIPSYAKGGKHQKEGFAIFAEAGYSELVKEPNKPAWVATRPTIGWLPSGTELMPMYDTPTVSERKYKDNSWEQTMFLAKTISRSTKRTNNTIKANINISFKDIEYKNRIIHG